MARPEAIEGTGEELGRYLRRSPKQRFRLVPLVDDENTDPDEGGTHAARLSRPTQPNEGMLAVMREIAERQKDRRYTDGSDSLRILREARAGVLNGVDSTDE